MVDIPTTTIYPQTIHKEHPWLEKSAQYSLFYPCLEFVQKWNKTMALF